MAKLSLLKDNISDAYAYHEVVLDDKGEVIDYIFLDINDKFTEYTGLGKDVLNKKVTEVLPGIEDSDFDWIATYGEIAQNGGEKTFQAYSEPLKKRYKVKVFSDKPGHFVTLFQDITDYEERKLSDKIIDYTIRCQYLSVGNLEYNFFTDSIRELTGASYVALNMVSEDDQYTTVTKSVSGISKSARKLLNKFGFQPEGAKWQTNHESFGEKDKLTSVKDLFAFVSDKPLLEKILKQLDKVSPLGELYNMEMSSEGDVLGSVSIIMPKGISLKYKELIEMYINQVSATLKRLQVENKLINKANEQEMLLDNIEAQVWYLKDVETYGKVNKAHADFFGVSKSDLEHKTLWEMLATKKEGEICIEGNEKVFQEKSEVHTEEVVKNGEGEERLLAISKTPKLDQNWKVEFVVCYADDITEQRKAEKDFINLVENSPDMVVRHDISSRHIYANTAVERELGISKDFLVGKTYEEIYQELKGEIDVNDPFYQKLAKMTKLIEEVAQSKEEQEVYHELFGNHLHGRIVPEIDENGEVNSVLVVTRDITKQKQVESELKQTKTLLEGLFESIQDGISVLNSDLTIRYTNNAMKTWHESDLPLEGKKCYQVYHKRGEPCEPCPSIRCLETGKVEIEEISVQTDIGLKWFELYSYPLFEEGSEAPTGIVEFVRDITEKKQAEEKIRYLSFHDTLTGLYNRAYFEEEFKRLDVDRQHPISLIIADIDDLKLFNDINGHTEGDNLIIEAAEVLKNVCRREDIIARWGGDEFVILLPNTNRKTAEKIAERIKNRRIEVNNNQICLSVGVATKQNEEQTRKQAFREADRNMYSCKKARKES